MTPTPRRQLGSIGIRSRLRRAASLAGVLAVVLTGCGYVERHELLSDSSDQIWLSEASQVRVRNAQSRVFDTRDRVAMMQAVVATLQDIGFQIEVVDETLGIVSGKRFLEVERVTGADLPSYLLYDEESLVVLNKSYRTWGPFKRRSNLLRLTVTVRPRNESQLIVRASAQYYLRPIEEPDAYQPFYAALEKTLLAEREAVSRP